jgi:hypothetical protein
MTDILGHRSRRLLFQVVVVRAVLALVEGHAPPSLADGVGDLDPFLARTRTVVFF